MTAITPVKVANNGPQNTSYIRMILLGLIVVSPSFLTGLNLSYTTIALPQMNLSLQDASWFGSVTLLTSPLSSIIAGFIIDKFGRKAALLYAILPSMFGWLLLYWNYNIVCLLLGQSFNGLTTGATGFSSQVYVGECVMMNHIRWRNSYVIWPGLSISLAATTMFFMSTFLNYHEISAVSFVLSFILFLLFCFFIPESPLWLYYRGRIGDAEWSEKKLGIAQPILAKHFNGDLQPVFQYDAFGWKNFKKNVKKVVRRDVYKPLIILSFLGVTLQFMGSLAIMTYMIDVIDNKVTGTDQNVSVIKPTFRFSTNHFSDTIFLLENDQSPTPAQETVPSNIYEYALISGFLMLMANVIATFGLPYIGIRRLLLLSEVSTALGMALLMYSSNENWFQLRVIAVWIVAFMFSLTVSVPQALAGEAFPRDCKGFASVTHLTSTIASSALVNTYPYLRLALGTHVYFMYAIGGILGAFYTYIFVPEIIGKTMEQVNENFVTRL